MLNNVCTKRDVSKCIFRFLYFDYNMFNSTSIEQHTAHRNDLYVQFAKEFP